MTDVKHKAVFISGPMSGKANNNVCRFADAHAMLKEMGGGCGAHRARAVEGGGGVSISKADAFEEGYQMGMEHARTEAEQMALDAITRTSVKPSGPVMRPTSELVAYARILERLLDSQFRVFPYHELREYIAPHWVDVFVDMEV